jgi:hypothetical protein
VRRFIEKSAAALGLELEWQGSAETEIGKVKLVTGDKAPQSKWVMSLCALIRAIIALLKWKRCSVTRQRQNQTRLGA